ncbi:hypothetical protein SLA2020_143450 [Shorea laevis]
MGRSNAALNEDSAAESYDATTTTKTHFDSETETDEDRVPATNNSPFVEGEKVLAYFKKTIYEAKVIKVEYLLKDWRYFLHYTGWNKSWDEWVTVDRLMKFTPENLEKQKAMKKLDADNKSIKLGRATQIKPRSSNVPRGKKRKADSVIKEKGAVPSEKLVNLQIPPTLKKQLVDDCEFITHLGKLVKLPRNPNVDEILKNYLDYRSKKDGMVADSLKEILKGIHCYFDKALPVMLLYKSERQQYEDTVGDDASPSSVYGAEHLLRLFVKLPELLFYANIEEETLLELQQKLVDFLKFLQKNQGLFFLSTYHVAEDVETSTNNQDN